MSSDDPLAPTVRHFPAAGVPVFNCHVYLTAPDETGAVLARAATLSEVTARGRNERDALRAIVARFKEVVGGHLQRGEPIPWLADPLPPRDGETQRFVPVHF